MTVGKIIDHAVRRVPSPPMRWTLRFGLRLLTPLAGAVATLTVERLRHRLRRRKTPEGAVFAEIDRELWELLPEVGAPVEPLAVLAERAHLTLAGIPGRPMTCLRAVPKRPGDDIAAAVALAVRQLEPAGGSDRPRPDRHPSG